MSLTDDRKPDLVLIPGWGLGNAAWRPLLPALEAHFRVHLFTLPGYDLAPDAVSPIAAAGPNARSFDDTVRAFIGALPPDAIVCGWSLGAELALAMAARAPERIRRLVLVGGTARFTTTDNWPDGQPPSLLATFAESVATDASAALQRFAALINQGDTKARPITRELSAALRQAPLPTAQTLLSGLNWLRDIDLRDCVAQIKTPTLLVHGAHDPLMPLKASEWLASQLPQARLAVFANAAHAPFLNDSARFITLLRDSCHGPEFA